MKYPNAASFMADPPAGGERKMLQLALHSESKGCIYLLLLLSTSCFCYQSHRNHYGLKELILRCSDYGSTSYGWVVLHSVRASVS